MSEKLPPKVVAEPSSLGRVGGYELLLELAAGGMATVYLAHAVDGRKAAPLVALKRPHRHLATDKVFLSMLIDEARIASVIEHPNVVKVRELGFEGGEPFVVMEYVEGASLSELRKALSPMGRTLDTRVAARIALDALAGLHAAHQQRDEHGKHLGIIHRDVSPHNVIVGMDGVARLTDFGIAKAEDRVQTTRTHEVKGKLAYLAPERVDKRRLCTVQSDIFSMAVVLWECIAGRRLFRGEEAIDTLQEVMNAPIPRLRQLGANVPSALDDVIARALSRSLETRHQTAADLAAAIERAVGKANIGSPGDVARVMEAVFGTKMAARLELLRASAPHVDVDHLLATSNVPARPRPSASQENLQQARLASLAPPAPSARYTFGQGSEALERARRAPMRIAVPTAIAGGTLFGGAVAFLIVARPWAPRTPVAVTTPVATVVGAPSAPPSVRRVVVPLPFRADRVRFDDIDRTLEPPADVAAFDVPRASGVRHRLVARASDGARAEAFVVEDDGVARPEAPGFAVSRGAPSADAPRAPSPVRPKPIGTTKNGFTKLK